MQYYASKVKKHHFLITPAELRQITDGFHHVIVNTGVSSDYTESDPSDFLSKYELLHQRLKAGEKLIWKNDYGIASIKTGITGHLENCLYTPTKQLFIPDFKEPCPCIETFCLYIYKDQLSASFSVAQYPENICGLCLSFPGLIEYKNTCKQHPEGIVDCSELDDYPIYETLLLRVRKMTVPLKLEINGSIRRTNVRVSKAAKTDLQNFHFISSNNIKVV